MLRKILGGLLIAEAALILIGSIANGSFVNDQGSAAATYGAFIGTLVPVVVNVLAGLFLFRFDAVYARNYVDGFRARKKQCTAILVFTVFYAVALFLAGIGVGMSGAENYLPAFVVAALPHFVPLMLFAILMGVYAVPYWACQKNFCFTDALLDEYVAADEVFYTYAEDNSVLANGKVLFFPRTFCFIPFEQIASVKFYNALEQDVIFTLTNGKKIEIVANKKQYDSVVTAVEAHRQ